MAKNEAYHSNEYYKQQRAMLVNGEPRALICFCIDVSQSMDEWWIEEGGLKKNSGTGFSDGHSVRYFDLNDIRSGYAHYKKIDKLNEVLGSLLTEFKRDSEICNKVAISIVVYSRFGKVVYDFLDCTYLDIDSCKCKVEQPETSMGDGIRTALAQIDEMESDLKYVGKDTYTPLLVFMTDGTPTDDPRKEFELVRERVGNGELHVFPLGIGASADMHRLREMFPLNKIPSKFTVRYRMIKPLDYDEMFHEIKDHVKQRQSVMVTEEHSEQSIPAIDNENVINNQLGLSFDYNALISLM